MSEAKWMLVALIAALSLILVSVMLMVAQDEGCSWVLNQFISCSEGWSPVWAPV